MKKTILVLTVLILLMTSTVAAQEEKKMQLSDVLLKMATNNNLTAQELDFLRNAGIETQKRNAQIAGWVGEGGKVKFVGPQIISPKFSGLSSATFSGTASFLNTGSIGGLSSLQQTGVSSTFYLWSATTAGIRSPNNIVVNGTVSFDDAGTGLRKGYIYVYDAGNNVTASYKLFSVNAASTDTMQSFSITLPAGADHIAFMSYQDSGGAGAATWYIGIFEV